MRDNIALEIHRKRVDIVIARIEDLFGRIPRECLS